MNVDWNAQLLEQLDWHWEHQLRPRLEGLTDDEYFWEPVPGCWSIRRRGASTAPITVGGCEYTMDYAMPPHGTEPVTTITWRLAHLIVGCLGARNAAHFGGPPVDYATFAYAGSAAAALDQLDDAHTAWVAGVRGLGTDGLGVPCGPAEQPFDQSPMAGLVLHIHKEVIHHGAEISLLRDLYLHKEDSDGI